MENILSYLDNMFAHLPKTAEVNRAKNELSQMMEDKYERLRAEGKTENEAVGQVISEFGNLNELADELGIFDQVQEAADDSHYVVISHQEAESYIADTQKSAKKISTGIAILFIGLSVLMAFIALQESDLFGKTWQQSLPANLLVALGIGSLMISIAIAVFYFITGSINSERNEIFERKYVKLENHTKENLKQAKRDYQPALHNKIAIGVALILLGVTAITILGVFFDRDEIALIGVIFLFLMLAVAIALFITGLMRNAAYEKLLNIGEYSIKKKRSLARTSQISGIYWGLITAGYLAWSFISGQWNKTWIVWPIAGVAYAPIVKIINAILNRQADK